MAAVDCSKTPRSKSIKARALTLRDHEARKLAEDGRVLIVREVKAPARGIDSGRPLRAIEPSDDPGLWLAKYGYGDDRSFLVRCPFGPVGSPLWGREAWSPDHAAFYPNFPHVYKAYGHPAAWEIEGGRVYSDEAKDWFPFRWRSSTLMPRHASRFPHLRHESCEVKRAADLTESDASACGFDGDCPIGSIPAHAASPCLYHLWHENPMWYMADRWLWCSLVVDLDRLEVADA